MNRFTQSVTDRLLALMFHTGAFKRPEKLYVGLCMLSEPGGAATGKGYKRQEMAATGNSYWTREEAANIPNYADVQYSWTAKEVWGRVTHFVIFDRAEGGNALYTIELTFPRFINGGDTLVVRHEDLVAGLRKELEAHV